MRIIVTDTALIWNHQNPALEQFKEIKEEVERPSARLDGKRVCDYLRELRLKLAEDNGIEFYSEEYPSVGPCAGTCAKCD